MDLNGRVIVITRGLSEIGMALAKRFKEHGAWIVLSDKDEKKLLERAARTGMIAIPADINVRSDIKKLIDKTIRIFGKIDLFVSNSIFSGLDDHYLSESERNFSCQSDLMFQMLAAKYVLPHMISRENGYLLNLMNVEGLMSEFNAGIYSTLKHPCLSLAERIAATYKNAGIKISVLCSDSFMPALGDSSNTVKCGTGKLQQLVELAVKGLQKEQFMISPDAKNEIYYN